MKTAMVGLLSLIMLAFALREAHAQTITAFTCSSYPYDSQCDGEANSHTPGGEADATSESNAVCSNNTYPASFSEGSADVRNVVYGAQAWGYVYTTNSNNGVHTVGGGISWVYIGTESNEAVAEVVCGGTTYSFDEHVGSYTYAQAYADITQ
jgi:hypothetical protein